MTTEGEVAVVTRALEDAPAETPGEVQELVTASGVAMASRKKGQNKINLAVVTDDPEEPLPAEEPQIIEAPEEPLPGDEPQVIEAPAKSSAARGFMTLPVLK